MVVPDTCSPVVELRRYTLHPGRRDTLIDLFDREFVETQEAVGMTVIGQFRDLGAPDQFVWLRGYPDMPSRAASLLAFYGGPVWRQHREAANATMIDSDDVLLLRPAGPGTGFRPAGNRPAFGEDAAPGGIILATTWHLDPAAEAGFPEHFERVLAPLLGDAGAPVLASFVTEHAANTFPALPVREGEHAFVWFSHFPDRAAHDRYVATRDRIEGFATALRPHLSRPPEAALLSPTARSRLRG